LAVLLALAVLTRSAGLALVAGFGLSLLIRRGVGVALAVSAPALVAAFAWGAWSSAHTSEIPVGMRDVLGPYGAWLAGQLLSAPSAFLAALPVHAWTLADRVLALLVPGLTGWPLWLTGVPFAALAVVGGVHLARRFPPLTWVPVAYLAMLLLWPFVDRRLVAPLHPWMVAMVGMGVFSLAVRWKMSRLRWALGVAVFVWISAYAAVTASRAAREWAVAAYRVRAGQLAAAVETLKSTADADAVVGAPEFWAALHIHGGWQVVPSARFTPRADDEDTPVWGTPTEQLDLWWSAGVTHILLEQGGKVHGAALDLLDARCPGAVSLVAEMPPQLLVRLSWDEACARAVGISAGTR
jgi:hypothetical protein